MPLPLRLRRGTLRAAVPLQVILALLVVLGTGLSVLIESKGRVSPTGLQWREIGLKPRKLVTVHAISGIFLLTSGCNLGCNLWLI